MKCKKCGKCCEAIVLPLPMKEIKKIAVSESNLSDSTFIARNFFEISEEEAFEINPYLKTWSERENYYYKCKMLDPISKTCICYSTRPGTCRNFPYYDRGSNPGELYSKKCGYQGNGDDNAEQTLQKV
jgi:Fe-S-cluster containining protein